MNVTITKTYALLACTECGAEAYASCNCHKEYKPVELAAKAIAAAPNKSDRAIAAEIGVSPTTVGKARAELSNDGQLNDEPRTGLDGKVRKQPTIKRKSSAECRREDFHTRIGILTTARLININDDPDETIAPLLRYVTADDASRALDKIAEAQSVLSKLKSAVERHLASLATGQAS